MAKVCPVLGKRYNKANKVSFSNKRSIKRQNPNIQSKRIWDPENNKWVRLNLSTSAIKLVSKVGASKVLAMARKNSK